jgi:hypothetical protein
MLVYFTDKHVHQHLVDVDDAIYAFLSKYECSAFKKQIYLADDGYYELKENAIFQSRMEFIQPPSIKQTQFQLSVSPMIMNKKEVSVLPTNVVKIDVIIERFKVNDTVKFVVERNDDVSLDYYFEIKGNTVDEQAIISFLSGITNVCVN